MASSKVDNLELDGGSVSILVGREFMLVVDCFAGQYIEELEASKSCGCV